MTTQVAISTRSFINTLGVNTHIDFAAYGYQNLTAVENAIKYLGLTNLRDSAQTASDATTWLQVAQATGAKFDDYIAETSPAGMTTDLGFVQQLAQEGILNYLEGGNEEDDAYPASLGNTLAITAQFQQQVYATGHALGLPVINMSFGSGWTADNNWQGDYDKVGDLSAYADYANAHTYPMPGQLPGDTISRLNGLANLAAASRPVITTEIGWDENQGFTQAQIANYVLDAALDGIKSGDVKTYYYGLFNDGSGNFGLMNSDGTAKPAGVALHDLTTLLADTGTTAATFTPTSLSYTLSTADNTVLMEKSDGTFWLSVWNESAGGHSATVTLGSAATRFTLFDPITGTSAVQTASNVATFTFTVPDHPVIVEIAGAPSGGSGDPGSGSSSPNPVVTVPASETVASGTTAAFTGVSVSDPWAASAPGTLALNVTATVGTVAMKDASGNLIAGSGTGGIHVSGTLAQLNAELATLTYTAGTANASVTVDVWDQAGVEATKLIGVTVTASAPSPNPVLSAPASETLAVGTTMAIPNVSVSDPWAATAPGTLVLNVTATVGTVTMKDASGNLVAGSGTNAIHVSGTLSQVNAELATLTYTAGTANASVTVDVRDQAGVEATKLIGVTVTTPAPLPDPVVSVPGAQMMAPGATVAVGKVSISDPWAASNPGTLALNVVATVGTVAMKDATTGKLVSGSGTAGIHISGTLSQLNAELATLSYTAGSTNGSVSVDVWDQAGVEGTKSFGVTVGPTITIASTASSVTENVNYAKIVATSGNHMIFIGGTGNLVSATGGTETIQTTVGGNTITTGTGNDTIIFAGSGNVINAGAGNNVLTDNGSNNTIVLPAANKGYDDIFGKVMTNGDKLDLRPLLAGTNWKGDLASIGNFIKLTASGSSAVISVDPSGVAGGATYAVGKLESSGVLTLNTLLAHSITT